MLARWSRRFPHFTLITQNVDGLHERAFAKATARPAGPTEVIRLHGSIWEVSCWRGCAGVPARWRDETVPFPALPPACPHCGGLTRPGEATPASNSADLVLREPAERILPVVEGLLPNGG